ncbi:MAG: hypothetical protein CMN86_08820 [Stappia sp.]|nr:hypothetical protein [Stappia sp.]
MRASRPTPDTGRKMTLNRQDKGAREEYARALEATVVYQVGELIVGARSSWKNAFALPWRLYRLHRFDRMVVRKGKGLRTTSFERRMLPRSGRKSLLTLDLIDAETGDLTALKDRLAQSRLSPRDRAESMLRAASLLAPSRPAISAALARLAVETDGSPEVTEEAAFLLYRAGHLSEPAGLLERLDTGRRPELREKIIREHRVLVEGVPLPSPALAPLEGSKPRLLYVSHLSLPHHTSGYATRTHGILSALRAGGHDVVCVTRPGYPWDRFDSRAMDEAAPAREIEGVRYLHVPGPSASQTALPVFADAAADALVEVIERERPTCVVAGSNYVNALPALMAARRTGLPFHYDIRGLWEFTSASKVDGWERSERFHLARRMEAMIASQAEGVFAISSPLREELINRGVPAERITLLPNGVDMQRFLASTDKEDPRADLGLPSGGTVFGFIGSMEHYEGLEDLMQAFSRLVAAGLEAWLVLVGDGPVARRLGELVGELGLVDRVRLVGRVPFSEVSRYYRLCDAFVYPRKNIPLTRLVPALKPLEAMAAGKPVIISELPALVELVGGGGNALLTPPGDIDSLTARMETLAHDGEQRARISEAGQHYARSRTWETSTSSLADILPKPIPSLTGARVPG